MTSHDVAGAKPSAVKRRHRPRSWSRRWAERARNGRSGLNGIISGNFEVIFEHFQFLDRREIETKSRMSRVRGLGDGRNDMYVLCWYRKGETPLSADVTHIRIFTTAIRLTRLFPRSPNWRNLQQGIADRSYVWPWPSTPPFAQRKSWSWALMSPFSMTGHEMFIPWRCSDAAQHYVYCICICNYIYCIYIYICIYIYVYLKTSLGIDWSLAQRGWFHHLSSGGHQGSKLVFFGIPSWPQRIEGLIL